MKKKKKRHDIRKVYFDLFIYFLNAGTVARNTILTYLMIIVCKAMKNWTRTRTLESTSCISSSVNGLFPAESTWSCSDHSTNACEHQQMTRNLSSPSFRSFVWKETCGSRIYTQKLVKSQHLSACEGFWSLLLSELYFHPWKPTAL